MKKIIYLFLCGFMLLAVSGCQTSEKAKDNEIQDDSSDETQTADNSSESTETLPSLMPEFEAVDINGNTITNEIFAGKKITMVNIWATYCGPCIDEMPALGDLSRSLPEDAQIVGLVIDVSGDTNLKAAQDIAGNANADFTHIVADETLIDMIQNILGVPTSFFVDEEGKLVGGTILGARSEKEYFNAITELLEK